MMIKNNKGFTLIELLIVVAIIAILAAIAIPQFSAYRVRGYNSAALADLRNAKTAEEAFFSDWQVYVSSAATGAAGAGALVTNVTAVPQVTTAAFISTSAPPVGTTFNTGLSANVGIAINTSANGGTYTMATKNEAGDRCYGTESDASPIFWVNGAIGGTQAAGMTPTALADTTLSDFAGNPSAAPCAGGTQVNWIAL